MAIIKTSLAENTDTHEQQDKFLTSAKILLNGIANNGLFIALPIVFLWFGAMKYTAYEAGAIEGLIANSPIVAFLLDIFSPQGVSNLIGTVEISIALLLASRFFSARLAAIGAAGATLTFLVTLSFFFSTPGVFQPDVGRLAISVLPGQFLLKDFVLLIASLWALNNSLEAIEG